MKNFNKNNIENIKKMVDNKKLLNLSQEWYVEASKHEYPYHFSWLGIPIIQFPQDILAMQEIIFAVKPDLIIETGIARGGSLVFYASMLHLLENKNSQVVGIDIDIRSHTHDAISNNNFKKYITMLEGSSIDSKTIQQIFSIAKKFTRPLLVLDSNHTEEHVSLELEAYSPLIKKNSYIVVFDTKIAQTPNQLSANRPWSKNNSPMQAVEKFLAVNKRFQIDQTIENKLLITECPSGFLKCIN